MKRISGIIFDMDGLLFDTEMLYYQATQKIADEMGFPYNKELYMRFLGVSDEEVWENYHQLFAEFGSQRVQAFIDNAYEETLRMFAAGEGDLKPGVHELLNYLEEARIPKVIASSNQRKMIDTLLSQHHLAERFDGIVSADDVSRAKPDPEIFCKAQILLGKPKEELLIFEDSQNGILAADGAGIPVILVPDLLPPTQKMTELAHEIFTSLEQVPTYLDSLQ